MQEFASSLYRKTIDLTHIDNGSLSRYPAFRLCKGFGVMAKRASRGPARPNIQLIAQEAGVAVSTVSRYLNSSSYVGAKTRQKIRGVIEKHNYRPNIMAQSLVRGHSKIIGVVSLGLDNQQEVLSGILKGGQNQDMSVLLSYTTQGLRQKKEAVDLLVRIQARGIIVMPEEGEDSREFHRYLIDIVKTSRSSSPASASSMACWIASPTTTKPPATPPRAT